MEFALYKFRLLSLLSLDNASSKTDQVLHAAKLFSLTIGRELKCQVTLHYIMQYKRKPVLFGSCDCLVQPGTPMVQQLNRMKINKDNQNCFKERVSKICRNFKS